MKRKSVVAILLLIIMVFAFAGCNYVSRPTGIGNVATDTSANLEALLQQPTKTTIKQDQQVIDNTQKPVDNGNTPTTPEPEPEPEKKSDSPFSNTSADVFDKIQALLKKVKSDLKDATSATGVSDSLMAGRTIYVYTPYDVSGKDDEMMKAVAGKLNMTVVVNNLGTTGVDYSVKMKKIYTSGIKADLMFVDQNIWGDIQYYTQPITSFVNFEIGDKLKTFRSSMSQNYTISDSFYKSEQNLCDYYVAAGIGAPYLLAYNKANLKSSGTLAQTTDDNGIDYKAVTLADPATMFKDHTWGLKAMQQMLLQSTVDRCVGLATVKDFQSNTGWWFGSDNVAGFKLNAYSKAAELSSEYDRYSVAGSSVQTLDTIQELYWTTKGSNDMAVASFISDTEKEKAVTKLFNTYRGSDAVGQYAMMGITAEDLPQMFESAQGAKWDIVGYPYGAMTENIIRSSEPTDGIYYEENGEDTVGMYTAGWASGFAVMERCQTPAIALRFAEDYTKAWNENYESSFMSLLSDAQKARYEEMKSNMGITFYESMMTHALEASSAYPGAASKTSSDQLNAMSEFTASSELFTHLIYAKETPLSSYTARNYPKWSSFFTTVRADGMAASYQLARVMFNY